MMPLIQQVFFYSVVSLMFVLILELVRRRLLKEYYSAMWIAIVAALFALVYNYRFLFRVAALMQVTPSIILLFIGEMFLLLLILQLSIVNSRQSRQIKDLVQHIALLKEK